MRLEQIPDAPAAPPKSAARVVELPRQALQRMEEARRLLKEQRFTEAGSELTSALRYNESIQEAHRLLATTGLFGGNTEQAKTHALRAIELQPHDAVGHYVLGRLAEQDRNRPEAIRRYRLALLCEPPAAADYRALTQYHLGLLLEQDGYCAAAAELLAAFRSAVDPLAANDSIENPELASVVRVHLGAVAMAQVRAAGALGRYGEAADVLAWVVGRSPKDWSLRGQYVRMLGRAGRWQQAAEAAAAFVTDCGACSESGELLLAVHEASGHPDDAVTKVREMLTVRGDNVDLQLLHVEALLRANRVDEAAKVLAEVSAANPDRPAVRMKLIALSRARGDWCVWLETLARELADQPTNLTAVEEELARMDGAVAEALLGQRLKPSDQPAAEARRLPVLTGRPKAALDFLLARVALRLNRPEQSRLLLESCAEQWPEFGLTALALARARMDDGRWSDAIRLLDTARKQPGADEAEIESLLGQCHDALDEIEKAIEHYQKAIQLKPSDTPTMMKLARLHERIGDVRAANRQYELIVAADGGNMLAREGIVRTLWAVGSKSQMMRLVDQITQMQQRDPGGPATQRCLALVKLLQPPRPDAKAYADRLRELKAAHPDDIRTREELAAALISLRDYDAACNEVRALLERDPHSARGNELLALILVRQLDFEALAGHLKRMIARHPNRLPWLTELAQLELYDRRYDEAVHLWNHVLELTRDEKDEGPSPIALLYRARLMQTYRMAGRFDDARKLAERWLAELSNAKDDAETRQRRDQNRWFLLAADAAAKETDRYLARVREWLAAEPESRLLQGWLLGVSDGYPPGSPGLPPEGPGLIGAKRFSEAALSILAWLEADPDDADLMTWLIDVALAAGFSEDAIELATSQLKVASSTEYRVNRLAVLREVYLRTRRYDDAIDTAKRLVAEVRKLLTEVEPERRGVVDTYLFEQQHLLAMLMARARRFDDAIAYARQMIEDTDELRREAEQVGRQQGEDVARRFQAMHQEQQATQRQTVLLRALMYIYQQQESMSLAEAAGRDAYKLMPDDVGLNNDLGYTLADAGKDLAEAERMIRYAAGEKPEEAAYLDSLGWVLYKTGRFEEACKWLMRASAVQEGQDPLIYDHLADTLWRLGRSEEAVRNWRRSLELHEQKLLAAESEADDKPAERTRRKLAAADSNEKPEVAPLAPASRPASRGG